MLLIDRSVWATASALWMICTAQKLFRSSVKTQLHVQCAKCGLIHATAKFGIGLMFDKINVLIKVYAHSMISHLFSFPYPLKSSYMVKW